MASAVALSDPDHNGHISISYKGNRIGCIKNFGSRLFGSWSSYASDKDRPKDHLIDSGFGSKKKAIEALIRVHEG